MGISTAERNRRKRERKKQERAGGLQQQQQSSFLQLKIEDEGGPAATGVVNRDDDNKNNDGAVATAAKARIAAAAANDDGNQNLPLNEEDDVEIEYVAEAPMLPPDLFGEVLRVPQLQGAAVVAVAAVVVSDEDEKNRKKHGDDDDASHDSDDEDEQVENGVGKRKLKKLLRPSVADLKRRVARPDLVEAHDVTSTDPEFLVALKAAPGTVPVPRHWGRKRKYLQGKRGFEKPPFQLPDFIVRTGIAEVRDTAAKDDATQSAKQKNRQRVAPKMGAIDVDYKTLYDAFFKHQTKPRNLTKFGELYHEGKELEVKTNLRPGWPFSKRLRDALGMVSDTTPPPWLTNMQRYGPPPSYPSLRIHGLNAPLPTPECQYGYHPGGWGKPPIDPYGRPLYGGNPFDPPGSHQDRAQMETTLVTSDGKTVRRTDWGALPGDVAPEEESDEEEEEEEGSGSEMEESDEEEEGTAVGEMGISGIESVLPAPPVLATVPSDLRKQAGDETPLPGQPQPLYKVIEQTKSTAAALLQPGTVFASDVAYVVPGTNLPEGAESVLSKAMPQNDQQKLKKKETDDDEELAKKFKF